MNKKIKDFSITLGDLGITEFPTWNANSPVGDTYGGLGKINQMHYAKDLDNDGDSDLVLTFRAIPDSPSRYPDDEIPYFPIILRNLGDGSFEKIKINNQQLKLVVPREIQFADFNLDGYLDIYIADQGYDDTPFPGHKNLLYLSNSDGDYNDSSNLVERNWYDGYQAITHSASVGDIDGDSYPDILVGETGPVYIQFNKEGLDFEATSKGNQIPEEVTEFNDSEGSYVRQSFSYLLTDINNDGVLDFISGAAVGGDFSYILYQDGKGNFDYNTKVELPNSSFDKNGETIDIASADINGDGLRDLLLTQIRKPEGEFTYAENGLQILIQNQDGTFNDETSSRLIGFISDEDGNPNNYVDWIMFSDFFDIDKDGDLDILLHWEGSWNENTGENPIAKDNNQLVLFNLGKGVFVNTKDSGNIDIETSFYHTFDYDLGNHFTFYIDPSDENKTLVINEVSINEPKYQLSEKINSSQNVLEAYSDEGISGTLNFSDGNNIVILDGQAETYRGLTGDDTYFVSQLLPKNGKVSIIDTEGLNIIQIPSNTYVDKSLFTKDAARLTLEDGREITINGADKFTYNMGGNVTDGTAGIDLTYADFATSFGISDVLNSSDAQTGVISDMYII
ncbi:VCBS repeat-containing protein [Rhodobiaceae bacterium]|nr:VCBS repeat-containing protein [Rhodobiaceae bacterium]